jgi:DNA-binding transcriptional regulator YhcF (GntR family)
MPALSIDQIFNAAIRIQLREDRVVTVTVSRDSVGIKFPTTRRLAEYLQVPHYYVLPYFAMMEEENLVTRAERVGIITTETGTRKYFAMLTRDFPDEAEEIFGPAVLEGIMEKVFGKSETSPAEPISPNR